MTGITRLERTEANEGGGLSVFIRDIRDIRVIRGSSAFRFYAEHIGG